MQLPLYVQDGWREPRIPYMFLSLAFNAVVAVIEAWLEWRQYCKYCKVKTPPTELVKLVAALDAKQGGDKEKLVTKVQDKFDKAQAYGRDKSVFAIVESAISESQGLVLTLCGQWPWLWDLSQAACSRAGIEGEIAVSLAFAGLLSIASMILSLPLSLYSTFVIEERHGFNKQTMTLFVTDKLKGLALSFAIGGPVLAALLTILRWAGPSGRAFLWLWAFVCILSLVMMTLYPTFIAPMFNKYTPLEEGDLKQRIEELAAGLKFPLTKLFVVDGSKRSAHSNAYFYGFYKSKRIVLYDTLLKQATSEEILAILGHECGHWARNHTLQGLIVSQIYLLAAFWSFGAAADSRAPICASFGFATAPDLVWLSLFFASLWAPVDHILTLLMNLWSRHNEFEADKFSVDLGYASDLQLGLVKLHLENLGNMCPDEYYSAYHHSHPPLVARLRAITAADSGAAKKRT